MGGASIHDAARIETNGHSLDPVEATGSTTINASAVNFTSPTFFNSAKLFSECSSVCFPSSMAAHIRHGCLPSKVVSTASATVDSIEREMSIPVHAVVCSSIQCAPLRYSAQQRTSSL